MFKCCKRSGWLVGIQNEVNMQTIGCATGQQPLQSDSGGQTRQACE